FQGLEMPFSPNERRSLARKPARRKCRVRLTHSIAQPAEYFPPSRPCIGILVEQFLAQSIQVVRRVWRDLARGHSLLPLLIDQDFEWPPEERELPGQGLVQHHADTIPITRLGYGQACALFRGHVGDRADDVRLRALVDVSLLQLDGEAEVEKD